MFFCLRWVLVGTSEKQRSLTHFYKQRKKIDFSIMDGHRVAFHQLKALMKYKANQFHDFEFNWKKGTCVEFEIDEGIFKGFIITSKPKTIFNFCVKGTVVVVALICL